MKTKKEAPKMVIPKGHKINFETLKEAFKNGDVALLSCTDNTTGEQVSAICALNRSSETKEVEFVPFAIMKLAAPYDYLTPVNAGEVDTYQSADT